MTNFLNGLSIPWKIAFYAGAAALIVLVAWVLTRLNKYLFKKAQNRKKGIHLAFFEKVSSAIIVIGCVIVGISMFGGVNSLWQTLLGGTAIISAVLAFAAQDVIKDILAGLMISIHKPFEIGDRVVLEDGTAGIVENITMRHVVLKGMDTLRIVIPNIKINAQQLTNFSYRHVDRAISFRFSVGYNSDVELVKRVIAKAVEQSKYSIARKPDGNGGLCYNPVYFLSFAESALIMGVTVYYAKESKTEIVTDDINTRVRKALIENGIEIPYNYINVINHTQTPTDSGAE